MKSSQGFLEKALGCLIISEREAASSLDKERPSFVVSGIGISIKRCFCNNIKCTFIVKNK
jgi:hypothetical protein